MDQLQRPWEKAYISDPIVLGDWFNSAMSLTSLSQFGKLEEGDESVSEDSVIADMGARLGGLDAVAVRALEAETDVSTLLCGDELDEDNPFSGAIPPNSQLATLKTQEAERGRKAAKLSYRQEAQARLMYKRYNFKAWETHMVASPCPVGLRPIYAPQDMVLTVVFCGPYNRPLEFHEIRLGRLMKMDMVFLVRGDTDLTSLRDKIACASDYATSEDHSAHPSTDDPAALKTVFAKDKYPSGFFYIGSTFYEDLRVPGSSQLSDEIVDWAERHNREVAVHEMCRTQMEGTRFRDLTLRLGQPQLYMHQGACEHLFMVTNVRLMTADDCQDADYYPICISSKPKKRTPCAACKRYTAKWAVYGSDRIPFEPGFFCDACFQSFFYDKDGRKVGEFKAVLYHDKSALIA